MSRKGKEFMNENLNNMNQTNDSKKSTSNALVIVLTIIILVLAAVIAVMLITKKDDKTNSGSNTEPNVAEKELDINSDLVQSLAAPFKVYDKTFTARPTYSSKLFTRTIDKMYLAILNSNIKCTDEKNSDACEDSSVAKWVKIDGNDFNVYVDADKVEQNFKQIFGTNVAFKNETLFDGKDSSSEDFYCGIPYYYDAKTNKYYGVDACGGDGYSDVYMNLYKAVQTNDGINLYYYNYEVALGNKIISNGKTIVDLTEEFEGDIDTEVNKLKQDGKIATVKLTFTKQNDGKYYVSSGEWI